MAGRIPPEFIGELIARTDIVDLIDARIPLKRVGSNHVGLCPFHAEKTPSFTVSREKQFYHCFGCGAHGNAIGFLMGYDCLDFREAVATLADALGLAIPEESNHKEAPAATGPSLYDIQDQAATYYSWQFTKHVGGRRAIQYLKQRQVSSEIAKRFRLGYAPQGADAIPEGLPLDKLIESGLVLESEKSRKPYGRFRDRLMFPIRDRRGRVIAFGGRIIDAGEPKYLNSPETPVFQKKKEVYGLYELLQEQPRPGRIFVVEGYMDVIALAQFGIPNAVATLGTAPSSDHMELLFRYTRELVFCFDGDEAGQKAAWRALDAALPSLREGRQVRFLILPKEHDPDSLIREEGVERFNARANNALSLSDYFFSTLTEGRPLKTIEDRSALDYKAKPYLEKLSSGVLKELMRNRLNELVGRQQKTTDWKNSRQTREFKPLPPIQRTQPSLLKTCIAMLIQNPEFVELISMEVRELLVTHAGNGIFLGKLLPLLEQTSKPTPGILIEHFRGDVESSLLDELTQWSMLLPREAIQTEFQDALQRFSDQRHHERLDALIEKSRTTPLNDAERDELRQLTQSISSTKSSMIA